MNLVQKINEMRTLSIFFNERIKKQTIFLECLENDDDDDDVVVNVC